MLNRLEEHSRARLHRDVEAAFERHLQRMQPLMLLEQRDSSSTLTANGPVNLSYAASFDHER